MGISPREYSIQIKHIMMYHFRTEGRVSLIPDPLILAITLATPLAILIQRFSLLYGACNPEGLRVTSPSP